jgi:hypothetical protein
MDDLSGFCSSKGIGLTGSTCCPVDFSRTETLRCPEGDFYLSRGRIVFNELRHFYSWSVRTTVVKTPLSRKPIIRCYAENSHFENSRKRYATDLVSQRLRLTLILNNFNKMALWRIWRPLRLRLVGHGGRAKAGKDKSCRTRIKNLDSEWKFLALQITRFFSSFKRA